jgi:hypothetical protein
LIHIEIIIIEIGIIRRELIEIILLCIGIGIVILRRISRVDLALLKVNNIII